MNNNLMDCNKTNNSYLIIANISKKNNVYQLLKLAKAYSLTSIIVGMNSIISNDEINQFNCIRMDKLIEVKEYLTNHNIILYGIEITESSESILTHQFLSFVAFMPGNEGTGLNNKQREIVDNYIYIPQYGNGIESLNVTVATSLILHQYTFNKFKSIIT